MNLSNVCWKLLNISHSVAHRQFHTLKLEVQSEFSFHMEEGSSDKSFLS